jgi:hypothetical protein
LLLGRPVDNGHSHTRADQEQPDNDQSQHQRRIAARWLLLAELLLAAGAPLLALWFLVVRIVRRRSRLRWPEIGRLRWRGLPVPGGHGEPGAALRAVDRFSDRQRLGNLETNRTRRTNQLFHLRARSPAHERE